MQDIDKKCRPPKCSYDLETLVYHLDRKSKICACAHLCLMTDDALVGGEMNMVMTELANTCLSQFFSPHGHVRVSWVKREHLRRRLLSQEIVNHTGCMVGTVERALRVTQMLDRSAAILFLSADARSFVEAHVTSFLDTLAVCLQVDRHKILFLDMRMGQDTFRIGF